MGGRDIGGAIQTVSMYERMQKYQVRQRQINALNQGKTASLTAPSKGMHTGSKK